MMQQQQTSRSGMPGGSKPILFLALATRQGVLLSKTCLTLSLLCAVAGCSPSEPTANDIAMILATKPGNANISAKDISVPHCKEINDKFFCEFLLRDHAAYMTLVRVGGGSFSESP